MTKDGHSENYLTVQAVVKMIEDYDARRIRYGKFVDNPYPSPKRKWFRTGRFCPICSAKLIKTDGEEYEGRPPIYYDLIGYVLYKCKCGYVFAYNYNPHPDAGMP